MKRGSYFMMLILNLSSCVIPIASLRTMQNEPYDIQYIPSAPISITIDEDFITYGFLGNGTQSDPYLIENLSVYSPGIGILVQDTSKYFTIRNCYVNAYLSGIKLENVANYTAIIENNTCEGSSGSFPNGYNGCIYVMNSNHVEINNNTCFKGLFEGIHIRDSNYINITNCNVYDNMGECILAIGNSHRIINNTLYDYDHDKIVVSGNYIQIINNTCSGGNQNQGYGFGGYESSWCLVANNTFLNTDTCVGFDSHDDPCSYNIIEDNYCFNSGWNSIEFYNFNGYAISENNVIRNNLCLNPYLSGIELRYCSETEVVNNTIIGGEEYGIRAYRSPETYIFNNTVESNAYVGISIYESISSTLDFNFVNSNYEEGIGLGNSSYSTITRNIVKDTLGGSGIALYNTDDCVIEANDVQSNDLHGLKFHDSRYLLVENNVCEKNRENGIQIEGCFNHLIKDNSILFNTKYGLYIDALSSNIEIYHNNFTHNNLGGSSQAYDAGSDNYWYSRSLNEGNFWSDWDRNGSYEIAGPSESIDKYPIGTLIEPPEETEDTKETKLQFTYLIIILTSILIYPIQVRKKKILA